MVAAFVLIHGAWHGAWCWQRVIPLLEAKGHKVVAPDLPGLGEDKTDPALVTLADNVTSVGAALDEAGEKAILVGHSLGGLTITQSGEIYPDRIAKLVYLTAFLPLDGEARADVVVPGAPPSTRVLLQSEDKSTYWLPDEVIEPNYYHDCDPETVAWAKVRLRPQPAAVSSTPVRTSAENWGRLPRAYIICANDQSIKIETQKFMIERAGCDPVITMQTSHSPFLSAPDALAGHLDGLAD
ncbi:MAG: alpha/beta fold hydrolase [Rhodospirillaceae bacterium]|jgi:pimeloyl-ACP methyl ester carboxylesterase|nr:alpha/beta fold hydrolase [Rhodospirillaceae bacterium]MBT3885247.1 alpha/beta fold hydrolase [Rhodospirillaceae bacterium]MBT4115707.1 alpha/beta fold hydrolase [Rhodospirillaceae bacterium]MBT4673398.1 alpha/beta fold hydrolase [Rhodospirillaceae bacterium]MBT4719745.1 alpha/beta fold hydrolase [Rhodospirillaceae bacterium]